MLAEKLSAMFLGLWGVCLWCMVSASGALCSKGDTDTRVSQLPLVKRTRRLKADRFVPKNLVYVRKARKSITNRKM